VEYIFVAGYRESKDGAGIQDERSECLSASRGREYLIDFERSEEIYLATRDRFSVPAQVSVDKQKCYTVDITKINMDKSITIYSTPTCHFCQITKDFLKEKGIGFTEYNVASDLEKRQEMIQKSGQMGVPVIFVGSEMIVGFDKERLVSLLGVTA